MDLILPAALRAGLEAAARGAYPGECCGLLEGEAADGTVRVAALHPAANLADDPQDGFELDPALHLRLSRRLRGSGRAIVGCYHSHPNGRGEPSPRDRANGCAAGFVWIIVAIAAQLSVAAFIGPDFSPLPIRE